MVYCSGGIICIAKSFFGNFKEVGMLKKILKVLAVIIVVLALGAYGIWRDEIHTLASIDKIQSRDDSHKDGSG